MNGYFALEPKRRRGHNPAKCIHFQIGIKKQTCGLEENWLSFSQFIPKQDCLVKNIKKMKS